MANGGINKAQVQKARNALIARGIHPSIDAVRIELGNTGSKTTIAKYLNELVQEGGRILGESVALGDTLRHIVADLAKQFPSAEMRFFDSNEIDSAELWARAGHGDIAYE